MTGLEFSTALARAHAPLVQRADAIVASLNGGNPAGAVLTDSAESAGARLPAHRLAIMLERSGSPRITRLPGANRLELAYADPVAESSLAALLACATPAGWPIAADPESLSVLALAERLAASEIPVLINGPTGTGKEVLSRFIHACGNRAGARSGDRPFVAVNCAAMPETMLEAMLFGHQKGAFTGATSASEGFFRAADGGTLLLDEIAEMPLALQAKLLRALQEGEVVPIGSTQPIKVDVRIIACANRDLPTEVREGRFRADLYYRLNVFPLALRPLRERPGDIAPLTFALALRHTPPANAGQGSSIPWFSDAALAALRLHGWPGNVRELENVVRRALLLAGGEAVITPEHIRFDSPARLIDSDTGGDLAATSPMDSRRKLSNIVQIHEARAIMAALEACGGSRIAAARQLGISERTLRYRLASFREAGLGVAGANSAVGARR